MAPRLSKRSIVSHALLAGGLLIVAALAPVTAQQLSPIDGQVAVRSDGAVYLISNGQRRWVATVAITDEELNAYPEAEPIYTGLAPLGAPSTGSAPAAGGSPSPATVSTPISVASTPITSPSSAPGTGISNSPAGVPGAGTSNSPTGSVGAVEVGTPTGAVSELDPTIPIEVDVDGSPKFEAGEFVTVNLKTRPGLSCELAVKWPNGTEVDQQRQTADSQGRCHYKIEIPTTASVGTAVLKGIAREGARLSRQNVEFEVIPSV